MDPLSQEWVVALAQASAAATDQQVGDRSGTVAVAIGNKQRAVVTMTDGRFVGSAEADSGIDGDAIDLTLQFTDAAQLQSYLSGSESIARAYIRGDFKPVGSTGLLLSVVELVESGALNPLA